MLETAQQVLPSVAGWHSRQGGCTGKGGEVTVKWDSGLHVVCYLNYFRSVYVLWSSCTCEATITTITRSANIGTLILCRHSSKHVISSHAFILLLNSPNK